MRFRGWGLGLGFLGWGFLLMGLGAFRVFWVGALNIKLIRINSPREKKLCCKISLYPHILMNQFQAAKANFPGNESNTPIKTLLYGFQFYFSSHQSSHIKACTGYQVNTIFRLMRQQWWPQPRHQAQYWWRWSASQSLMGRQDRSVFCGSSSGICPRS